MGTSYRDNPSCHHVPNLITGSTDGFGLCVAQKLIQKGHTVYLHARSAQRAQAAENACPGAAGTFMPDSALPMQVFVNVLAPHILTCLMHKPKRLIYISSKLHKQGQPANMEDLFWARRGEDQWNDFASYCDTKLQVNLLANAVAKRWKGLASVTTVHPGWVATKLGGQEAPDRLEDGVETYVKHAEGDYGQGLTAAYFEPRGKLGEQLAAAGDEGLQERVVALLEEKTGLKIPA
ncbi:hypothetical protein BJY01DRAFT_237854 [Aspergillus pseudoustus]|uniref:NAD(P)-binding protein n=1 Tax=Aspergillus pseudoustus TaxID=1810923 RepID=A0ABR4JEQ4_9EURO